MSYETAQQQATQHHHEHSIEVLRERIRLLEEDNHRLATLLREHGIEVREHTGVAMELPPPIETPMSEEQWQRLRATMGDPERVLVDEQLADGDSVYYAVCSSSRTDVGYWLSKAAVWVVALERDLLLLAAGKHPLVERIPYGHIRRSLYNHVTGELVLAPAHNLRVERVALPPAAGYQILAQIYAETEDSKEEPEQC